MPLKYTVLYFRTSCVCCAEAGEGGEYCWSLLLLSQLSQHDQQVTELRGVGQEAKFPVLRFQASEEGRLEGF